MTHPPKGSNRPLRIAVDARSLLCKHPRGEGKSLLRLYEAIVAARPDVEAILFGDSSASEYSGKLPAGARVVAIRPFADRWNAWENFLFPLRAKLLGCQVMHCASSGAPWRTFMPMVMTVHDLIPILFDDGQDTAARRLFLLRLTRGLEQASTVMTVSKHTRSDLLRAFPFVAERTRVIYWGAERTDTVSTASDTDPTVLVFGGEAHRKNTEYTVDRFIAAAKRVPKLRMHVIGVSSERQRMALHGKINEANLVERVSMPGFVSEAELRQLLASSSLLLYLSLYEGFGVPILEAVGSGLPVLASNLTSITEVLAGVPGCYDLEKPLEIEDAMVKLATSPEARVRLAISQAAVLDRFDWQVAAHRALLALDSAASRSGVDQTAS